jgi:Signal transduction histidine kinase
MDIKKLLFLSIIFLSILSCKHRVNEFNSPEEKAIVDSIFSNRLSADSVAVLLSQFIAAENWYGVMQAHIVNANRNQSNSNYNESLEDCKKALEAAEQISDTIEIMNILSSMGTNLRRLGAMGEASSYFYKVLNYYHCYSDNNGPQAKKSRLIALNSIGNINKTIGNIEAADSLFRVALQGSLETNDIVGCAINSANIGLIFEQKSQYDSAWHYQRKAMEYNQQANYKLGIAITHVNYGKLYEKQGDYDSAMREYQNSMDSTVNMSNRWQWLMSSTKWIGLNIKKGNYDIVRDDLDLAERYAQEIHSITHLSDVARLNYLYYEGKGNYSKMLQYFKMYKMYSDSLRNTQSTNETHNLRLQYERENSNREILAIQKEHEGKQRNKNAWLAVGAVVLLFAVTAILFLIYALRMRTRSQKAIKQIDEMRSNFFTNITHEFRTPLTVIIGMAEQQKIKYNNDKGAQVIIRQSEVLLNMVNQLLDMAKVKSSVDQSKWCHDDVAIYTGMMAEAYRDYFSVKGIDLIFKSDKRNIFMDFIPEYFDKILRNLLSNAQKHTPRGGSVTIVIASENKNLTLIVADTGIGISLDDLPHIFEEFYQGDKSHAEVGTGIGLSFVHKMVENMGGRITARNLPEGGAEFSITMPLKQDFEVRNRCQEVIQTPRELYNADEEVTADNYEDEDFRDTVLIIEDNADVRFYIGSLLNDKYSLRFASNGEEGLAKAKDFMPDLIVTDLMMPVMDGHAVCRAIRENDILNHIPIIIITAKATEKDKQQALEAGADAYICKPFNAEEFNIRVSKLLEQRRLLRNKYSRAMISGSREDIEMSNATRQFINRLTSVIYERISDTELTPDIIADKMCMSRSQLNRKIRNITGNSTSAYILHVRVEKAKRLLATNEIPIGDIAVQCGFDDSSYFSRVFRQVYQVTPSQFRQGKH